MIVFDILVLVIIALSVIGYAKKGLVLVLLTFGSYIVSAILASVFGSAIGSLIKPSLESALEGISYLDKLLSASAIANGIGFILVFIAAMIATGFVARFLSKKIDIPVVAQINHLLGGVCGLLLGVLFVQVLVLIVFMPIQLIAVYKESAADLMEKSTVARWFFDHNLIRLLLHLE
ncbi:MAG: CvpA family protein [Eubacteriales bacterium]